jgi:hypothetical protein
MVEVEDPGDSCVVDASTNIALDMGFELRWFLHVESSSHLQSDVACCCLCAKIDIDSKLVRLILRT